MNDWAETYDRTIASHYDEDRFGLLAQSRRVATDQIRRRVPTSALSAVLDTAVGTATTLLELREHYPRARFSGVDVSAKMLAIARRKMDLDVHHDDVRNVARYASADSVDLVLVHYLLAYVELEVVIGAARTLLRPGGLCSVASTTYECFPLLQELATHFLPRDEIALTHVPDSSEALLARLDGLGFDVLDRETVSRNLEFHSVDDLYGWGMTSGWLTQNFSALDAGTLDAIRARDDLVRFPLEDAFRAVVVLARKR